MKTVPMGKVESHLPKWDEKKSAYINIRNVINAVKAYENALKFELEAVERYKAELLLNIMRSDRQ